MRAKRTDQNQTSIVQGLRDAGVPTRVTNHGDDWPDLVTDYQGVGWVLIEVKMVGSDIKRGQLLFMATSNGPVGVATDFNEAYALATDPAKNALSEQEKTKIAIWLARNAQRTLSVGKFRKILEG